MSRFLLASRPSENILDRRTHALLINDYAAVCWTLTTSVPFAAPAGAAPSHTGRVDLRFTGMPDRFYSELRGCDRDAGNCMYTKCSTAGPYNIRREDDLRTWNSRGWNILRRHNDPKHRHGCGAFQYSSSVGTYGELPQIDILPVRCLRPDHVELLRRLQIFRRSQVLDLQIYN